MFTIKLESAALGRWYAYNSICSAVGWSPACVIGSGSWLRIFFNNGRSSGLYVVT